MCCTATGCKRVKTLIVRNICLFFCMLAVIGCSGGGSSSTPPMDNVRLQTLKTFWDSIHNTMQSQPGMVFEPPNHATYAAYAALNFVSAYWITGNNLYRDDAARQLTYAHGLENADHMYVSPVETRITRDALARHIFSLAVSGLYLRDNLYLRWADDAAQSALSLLRRDNYTSTKQHTYRIFYSSYNLTPPYEPNSALLISTNQNAAMGLAFTLLYHSPASRFYHSEVAREIALSELWASIDPQVEETGEIPLGDPPGSNGDCYDTSYGAYTVFSWSVANAFWKDPEIASHIVKASDWLRRYPGIDMKCYPTVAQQELLIENSFTRALVYYFSPLGFDDVLEYGFSKLQDQDIAQIEMTKLGRETPFVFYDLAGIRQQDYLD